MSLQINCAETLAHSEITELLENVFIVKGTYKAQYGDDIWQFSRNMVILRENDELSIINSIRLNESGLKALENLGTVKNVIKLGSAHGIDDAFYVGNYGAKYWMLAHDEHEGGLRPNEVLSKTNTPSDIISVYELNTKNKPEALLLLKVHGGVLVSCDSIKNWDVVDAFFSTESGEKMSQYGMIKSLDIDLNWVKNLEIPALDYKNLLKVEFKHFVPGHGTVILNEAYPKIEDAILTAFPH
ncbi:hypothetical protein J7384_05570 [Endozoicomonas sp. G2_1]|uniref:hypothetical protein n=1 Tax=Endozoicomonas sp. G2_1 TaxID=2821091 RepID=UPI001ADC6FC2|nr:hypothetical protein [Endozoicomonas sp. G2_1]MBO9489824.1 hypothetical protein [Endozoicomonas sp. G2_1]